MSYLIKLIASLLQAYAPANQQQSRLSATLQQHLISGNLQL